jgi:hypothetical protein
MTLKTVMLSLYAECLVECAKKPSTMIVVMLNVARKLIVLIVFMLSVANKPIMLFVVMLSVLALKLCPKTYYGIGPSQPPTACDQSYLFISRSQSYKTFYLSNRLYK